MRNNRIDLHVQTNLGSVTWLIGIPRWCEQNLWKLQRNSKRRRTNYLRTNSVRNNAREPTVLTRVFCSEIKDVSDDRR